MREDTDSVTAPVSDPRTHHDSLVLLLLPMSEQTPKEREPKITVAGVSFTAADVVSAVVKIGRKVHISEKETEPSRIGFPT
jgi:hypothetical protein